MSEEKNRPLTLLDEMVGDDSLQLLKAAVPYMPKESRQLLCIYAKSLELKNTISLFFQSPSELSACEVPKETDPLQMLADIRRYLSPGTQKQVDSLLETLSALQMLEMLQDPDGSP